MVGGVRIESELGADGHSDADVLLHAVTDAILGALAAGDIGTHFPDSDERWQGAESMVFLRFAAGLLREQGFAVANLDSTVHLEKPRLRPYIDDMRKGLAGILEVDTNRISIKAKTGEGVGVVGKAEAIRAEAVVLLSTPKRRTVNE
jgi:2-C-methyl-D-erythritol 2,4-cyclodiphosphate synthase